MYKADIKDKSWLPEGPEEESAIKGLVRFSMRNEVLKYHFHTTLSRGSLKAGDTEWGTKNRSFLPAFSPPAHNHGIASSWDTGRYSDKHLSTLAFKSIVSWYTRGFDPDSSAKLIQETGCKLSEKDTWFPQHTAFVNDLSWPAGFEVKESFARCGSLAFFDSSLKILGIYSCEKRKLFLTPNQKPNDHKIYEHYAGKKFETSKGKKVKDSFLETTTSEGEGNDSFLEMEGEEDEDHDSFLETETEETAGRDHSGTPPSVFESSEGVGRPGTTSTSTSSKGPSAGVTSVRGVVLTETNRADVVAWYGQVRHWLMTFMVLCTFREHLGAAHYFTEQRLANFARIIPAWHPVRRMLKPHVWHSSFINLISLSGLVNQNSLGNFMLPFTQESHPAVAVKFFNEFENITPIEMCARKQLKKYAPEKFGTKKLLQLNFPLCVGAGTGWLIRIGSVSDWFQTSFRPVSDRFQTSGPVPCRMHSPCHSVPSPMPSPCHRVMSDAQSCRMHRTSPLSDCHSVMPDA